MKEAFISEVMEGMLPYLDNMQMIQLERVLGQVLQHYEDKVDENIRKGTISDKIKLQQMTWLSTNIDVFLTNN